MEDTRSISSYPRLAYLDALRALAICMVVAIHARAYVNLAADLEAIIKPIVTVIAVPVFFLCDGFLFVHGRMLKQRFDYRRYLLSSAKRLLIPWILFSLFYLALRWMFEVAGILRQELVVGQDPISILLGVYGSAIAPQMYFLLSLFLIRTLTIFLRHLATVPIPIVWIAFLIYAFMFREVLVTPLKSALAIDLDPIRHAFWGLQYYLLGTLLARHHVHVAKATRAFAFSVISACCLAVALVVFERSLAVIQFSCILFAYFLFLAVASRENPLSKFGKNSMGIYLFHAPALLKGVSGTVRMLIAQPLLSYFAVITITTVAAYLATRLLRRIPYGTLIFGEIQQKT